MDLPATLETQYYNGSAWIRNTLDDCTSFPELIQFGGAALTAGVTVGSGTATASYTSLASSTVTLVDGTSGLIFSAPGIGNTGSFQIDFNGLSGLDHLQYDWNGGGKEFPSPATITFGSFRGHDKIIVVVPLGRRSDCTHPASDRIDRNRLRDAITNPDTCDRVDDIWCRTRSRAAQGH